MIHIDLCLLIVTLVLVFDMISDRQLSIVLGYVMIELMLISTQKLLSEHNNKLHVNKIKAVFVCIIAGHFYFYHLMIGLEHLARHIFNSIVFSRILFPCIHHHFRLLIPLTASNKPD